MFDSLDCYPLFEMTSAFADQNLAHTSTPGLFVNYTIPPTQGCLCENRNYFLSLEVRPHPNQL
jgi:hypothetical protein